VNQGLVWSADHFEGERAVLYIGHGTRSTAGLAQCNQLTMLLEDALRSTSVLANKQWLAQTCYLELCDPDIPSSIAQLVSQNVREIYAQPVFLFSAGHMKRDIPAALREASDRFPGVRVRLGTPVGEEPELIEVTTLHLRELYQSDPLLYRSVAEATDDVGHPSTTVLFVGRGSLDAKAQEAFMRVSAAVYEDVREFWPQVHWQACTLTGLGLSFTTALTNCQSRRVVLLPYLLFAGRLTQTLHAAALTWQQRHLGASCQVVTHLGHPPSIVQCFSTKVSAALCELFMDEVESC